MKITKDREFLRPVSYNRTGQLKYTSVDKTYHKQWTGWPFFFLFLVKDPFEGVKSNTRTHEYNTFGGLSQFDVYVARRQREYTLVYMVSIFIYIYIYISHMVRNTRFRNRATCGGFWFVLVGFGRPPSLTVGHYVSRKEKVIVKGSILMIYYYTGGDNVRKLFPVRWSPLMTSMTRYHVYYTRVQRMFGGPFSRLSFSKIYG